MPLNLNIGVKSPYKVDGKIGGNIKNPKFKINIMKSPNSDPKLNFMILIGVSCPYPSLPDIKPSIPVLLGTIIPS